MKFLTMFNVAIVLLLLVITWSCRKCTPTTTTVVLKDTVYVPKDNVDTTYTGSLLIKKGRLTAITDIVTKYDTTVVRDTVTIKETKTIRLRAECSADTIIITKPVKVIGVKEIVVEKEVPIWYYIVGIAMIAIILLQAIKR